MGVYERERRMLIGYGRVSKGEDQDDTLQVKALEEAGCERVYSEAASGGRWDRPELHRMLDQLRSGDVVVVWKLDRLTRSLKDLLLIMEKIDAAGAGFRSLTEAIDTTSPAGRMMMQMVGTFAEFERAMIRERTRAGLDAAAAQGRKGGRKAKLNAEQKADIADNVLSGRKTGADLARLYKVSQATVTRVVAEARAKAELTVRPPQPRVMRVELHLRVENNSKFVRGKTQSRREIEEEVLSRYTMEKPHKDGWNYILTIPYETDEELDRIIYEDILAEAHRIADWRNGFIEADVTSLDDPDRGW